MLRENNAFFALSLLFVTEEGGYIAWKAVLRYFYPYFITLIDKEFLLQLLFIS